MASPVTTAWTRWVGIVVLALVAAGCGGDGDSGDSDDASEAPTESAASYDGAWSGTLSTGGSIEFRVADGVITAAKISSGDDVFGPRCGTVNQSNEFPDEQIAIDDGQFSWGGLGEGIPVDGQFDSGTTASGTAEFSPPEVNGEPAPGCSAVTATWAATNTQATETGTPTEASTSTGTAAGVSAASAQCVTDLGYEIAEDGATDLPIADAAGEGLPEVDGSAGIGIRGEAGSAVFFVYETNEQANTAYLGSTSNPDIELIAPRVDAIAVDNVFIMSSAGFISDDRFYLADCFD
jgi:hypothetical protein